MPDDTITIKPRKEKKRGPVPRMKGPPISIKKKAEKRDSSISTTNQMDPLAMLKDKQKIVNYGQESAKDNLEQAIIEWDTKCGRALVINGEERNMQCFAGVIGIPYNTFQKYLRAKVDKHQDTGK